MCFINCKVPYKYIQSKITASPAPASWHPPTLIKVPQDRFSMGHHVFFYPSTLQSFPWKPAIFWERIQVTELTDYIDRKVPQGPR